MTKGGKQELFENNPQGTLGGFRKLYFKSLFHGLVDSCVEIQIWRKVNSS